MKRKNYISWDEYFMGIALLSAERSKDPNTQVGACIVDENNRIISTGYNGMPIGCNDNEMPWDREGNIALQTKYMYVCHAELNAILNSPTTIRDKNARIYVGLFPCNECAKAIIQSGIKEIIYISDKYKDTDGVIASKMMLDKAGVKYRKFKINNISKVTVCFDENLNNNKNKAEKEENDILILLNTPIEEQLKEVFIKYPYRMKNINRWKLKFNKSDIFTVKDLIELNDKNKMINIYGIGPDNYNEIIKPICDLVNEAFDKINIKKYTKLSKEDFCDLEIDAFYKNNIIYNYQLSNIDIDKLKAIFDYQSFKNIMLLHERINSVKSTFYDKIEE